jgi:hypothetical protein
MGAVILGIACLLVTQIKVKAGEKRTTNAFLAAD